MKHYKVNVNGNVYDITLEVMDGAAATATVPVATPTSAPAPATSTVPATPVSGGQSITAPMPGNILAINVKPGETVKKGTVLMVLEAMKMENEIMSPADATVVSVDVSAGATVDTGAVLCVLG